MSTTNSADGIKYLSARLLNIAVNPFLITTFKLELKELS